MAERDRYDWDRDRGYDRDRGNEREYGRGRERDYDDRGMVSRGTDEVRSWFGDDDARRRREMDEQRDRWRERDERDYGANSERARNEHGWSNQGQRPDTQWESHRRDRSAYGDQRDFVGRSNDWSGSQPYTQRSQSDYYDRDARWAGGSRDYGDEDVRRLSGNWRYPGGFAAGQPRSGFSGGYGDFGSTTGEGRWSGGRFAGRGPRNYQRSDERIREDVNERLTIDPRIDASDIDVRVENGQVTLTGMVDQRRTRRLAEEIIEDLPGVRDVRNDIQVNRGWDSRDDTHRQVGEQSHNRQDGSIGHSGDPQKRDDVTTVNVKEGTRK